MSDTRHEVRIKVSTRGVAIEAVAEVYGDHTPREAAELVRDALRDATIYTIDPAVEG